MRDELDGRKAWTVATLLFLAQIINYFDKSVMGLAAPSLMKELDLTPEQYGLVASSFFSLYAVSGLVVGFFVAQRVRSKPLLAILVLIWSLAQLPIIFSASLSVLIASRILLGVGEGPGSPTATSAAHEWFSNENRNMPTALLMLGASLGSVIAGPLLSHVMILHGWRAGFALCSALGIMWLLLWLAFGASGPRTAADLPKVSVPDRVGQAIAFKRLWTDRTIIGSLLVGGCAYWVVGFTVAWLAPLIRTGLGFDAAATGWVVSFVSGANSVLLLLISYVSQRLLKRGFPSRIARVGVNALCMAGSAIAFVGAALVDHVAAKLVLVAIGGALPTLTFTLGPAIVSEATPPEHRSRALIIIYAAITVAGFVSPLVAGQLIGSRGIAGYDAALTANAIVVALGALGAILFLRPEESALRLGGERR